MQAVAHGSVRKRGLPAAKAREYVAGQTSKGLPAKTGKRAKKR
jgi:hypothetical protein